MASTTANSHANGASNGALSAVPKSRRFADIPSEIDIPVHDQEDEAVEIDLELLADDPTELCTMLENENAARTYWMTVALAYAKQKKIDFAIEMLIRGGNSALNTNPKEKLSIVSCLCWMYLWKSREAPRIAPEGTLVAEAKTKEYYLQLATSSLNEASRINPAFPPLFLARGVLYLLRASLQAPSKVSGAAATSGNVDSEKAELVRSALKSFEDAIKVSSGRNMLAVMGKARALFSLGKYPEALAGYQEALQKMPDLIDPDPRIGIGCCFWQLGFKEDAKAAWHRSLEINPDSKTANILLGLFYFDSSGHVPANSPEFLKLYKKAMTEYAQKAFKLDKNLPLTCATFANYFLASKNLSAVDSLAHRAIQYTDVNAIASDGWYLLARKEHYSGDADKAVDYYRRADDARGGTDRGYLPAKFGAAQLSVVKNDLGEAKLRLEKMIQQSRNHEAMILLGTLYAEEVFANQYAAVREDKSAEAKKAISYLENVRNAWKDTKKSLSPDASVLLNLARLYESEQPDKALQCLLQVEQLEINQLMNAGQGGDSEDEIAVRTSLRKFLPPQLLNNIGCFYYQADKHEPASDMFEAALSACMTIGDKDETMDTDALVTTISFNLGRSYEARGMADQAADVYEGLLKRHDDYTDACTRLAYIKLRKNPNKEGPDAIAKLYQEHATDLEVRALYGWFLGKLHSRKRPANIAEDAELRHYKHTLQNYDKHDRYALVGMGNMYLTSAREMRRDTEPEKQKRSATYSRAVEFFEKALQLDPKNAYAAQGVAIALVEDKKDYKNALQIFLKVRDTVKDANVYVNLGHIYAELRQFSKAIESYEIALAREGKGNDAGILSCLGRAWLSKGRSERNLDAYKMALECAQKALAVAPEQVHFKFNVAFVQIQLTMTIQALPEVQRSVAQLEDAAAGLEAAIQALDELAASPQPPYPKHDLEQRANMARNTQRKQLERATAAQRDFEERNREKLAAALEQRQAELRRRDDERRAAEERARERQDKIRKEREEMAVRDRALAEQRAEEERVRADAEMTTDSETGDRVKRKRKAATGTAPKSSGGGRSRRKKGGTGDDDDDDGEDESGEERHQPRKKRRRTTARESSKYKSAEIVEDSDEDDDDELAQAERQLERGGRGRDSGAESELSEPEPDEDDGDRMDVDDRGRKGGRAAAAAAADDDDGGDDEEEQQGDGEGEKASGRREATSSRRQQPKRARRGRIVEESDEEEEEAGDGEDGGGGGADTSMADAKDDEDEDE